MSGPGRPTRYEIRVDGVLDERWAEWFGGLQVSRDGTQTVIAGPLPDQSALHGLLALASQHPGQLNVLAAFLAEVVIVYSAAACTSGWSSSSLTSKLGPPRTLACQGGSNGGLLMGAMITQHPEQYRAVVSSVGIYDMLRVELSPNGAFNVPEYGTVKDAEQFRALYAYSPYHPVVDGTRYPAVLLRTGEHDGRVDPSNSRKMAARLQAATSSEQPVLLRLETKAGHGAGKPRSKALDELTDIWTFLFSQLGMHV